MTDLAKVRVVLDHTDDVDLGIDELVAGPILTADNYSLTVEASVWAEMGYPETITVTIEPGDLLNVGDDSGSEAAHLGPKAIPDRFAVDAKGYVWRVWDDVDHWSMAPTNPDNSPVPQPVTWFVPQAERDELRKALRIAAGNDPQKMADALAMARGIAWDESQAENERLRNALIEIETGRDFGG